MEQSGCGQEQRWIGFRRSLRLRQFATRRTALGNQSCERWLAVSAIARLRAPAFLGSRRHICFVSTQLKSSLITSILHDNYYILIPPSDTRFCSGDYGVTSVNSTLLDQGQLSPISYSVNLNSRSRAAHRSGIGRPTRIPEESGCV